MPSHRGVRDMQDDTSPSAGRDPIERASVDELRALQLERLRWTLRHAYANVPHYRAAFDAAGVHPDDCQDLADLAKYPLTSKADLRENYPFGMFAVPREQVVRIHASSGTTGRATVVGYTRDDTEVWAAMMARSIRAAGGRPGHILHNAYGYGLFTGGLGAHYGAGKLGCTVVPVSGGMTERQVTLIRDFRPDIIMVTPSYMLAIVDEMERQGDDPAASSLRFGIFGAEPWTNEMRTEMETRRHRRHRHLRPVRGDGPGRGAGVRGDQGRPAHLGGPLLPRGDRPAHRRGAARRRRGRARLHLADQAGHAGHPLPDPRPHPAAAGDRAHHAADAGDHRPHRRHDHLARSQPVPDPDRGTHHGHPGALTALPAAPGPARRDESAGRPRRAPPRSRRIRRGPGRPPAGNADQKHHRRDRHHERPGTRLDPAVRGQDAPHRGPPAALTGCQPRPPGRPPAAARGGTGCLSPFPRYRCGPGKA